jgi:hypothetical protein
MKIAIILFTIIIFALLVCGCATNVPATTQTTTVPTLSENTATPDLTGTWIVKAEGGSLLKSDTPGQYSHYLTRYNNLTATWVITNQTGRVVQGNFISATGNNERAVGVISMDNRNLYIADMDGFLDLHIINDDLMTLVYRHVTPNDSVVSVGTWTRVK